MADGWDFCFFANGKLAKTTDYAGEFIYENGVLQFIQHEEGRIIQEPDDSYTYQYHLKDHLGNARLTFTTGQYNSQYTATMEDGMYAQESEDFYNLDPRVQGPYPNSTKMVRLNSASPIGPALGLEVSRGDTINMSFTAYYEDATGHGTNSLGIAALASALTTAYGGLNGGSEGQQLIYDVFNNHAGVAVAAGGTADDTHPAAYLNYLVFDSEYNLISEQTGYVGIDDAPGIVQTKTLENLVIDQAGFIYIYLSNESNSSNYVFFDDFDVVIGESPVLETIDYYPFGLTFNSYSKPGMIRQNFKYNGKELVTDLGLGWYDYQARWYDPALGRWHTVDPATDLMRRHSPYNYAFDNPVRYIDPDGMFPTDPLMTRGFGNGVINAIKGVGNFIAETVTTRGQNLVDAAVATKDLAVAAYNDPSGTAEAIVDNVKEGVVNKIAENGSVNGAVGEILGEVAVGIAAGVAGDKGLSKVKNLSKVSNAVPKKVSRVISNDDVTNPTTLGRPGSDDVFVTDPADIKGLDSKGIAEKLTIPESESGFHVIEFDTPNGIASPINRNNPGFVGKGKTAGGAKEFVIPNSKIPEGATKELIK